MHKKTLHSLERNDYQCPQCDITFPVRNIPCEQQTSSFSLKSDQLNCIFEETQKSFQDVIRDVFWPTCPNEKFVYLFNQQNFHFLRMQKKAEPALACRLIFSRTKNRQIFCLVVIVRFALQEKRVVVTKKKNNLQIWRNFSANHNQAHLNLNQKKIKNLSIYGKIVSMPHWLIQLTKTHFHSHFIHFQFTVNEHDFLSIGWSLDFGPDSVNLTVKHLVQKMTICFQQITLAAWSLLFSQRQDLLKNHLARVPINPNQGGYGDQGWSALKFSRTRYGNKRVSTVWSGRCLILLAKWSADCRRCLYSRHRHILLPFNF